MNDPPRLRQCMGERSEEELFSGQRHTSGGTSLPQRAYSDLQSPTRPSSDPPFDFSDLCNEDYGSIANILSSNSNPTMEQDIRFQHQDGLADNISIFAIPNLEARVCSAENYAEASGVACTPGQQSGGEPNRHYILEPSSLVSTRQSPPIPSSPYYVAGAPQLATRASRSRYQPFGAKFSDAGKASTYRKVGTRFNRKPCRVPQADNSIPDMERNRQYHVQRIYNAMTRPDAAKDNNSSIAMKRWVHGAYYDSILVEAYAHKVFDCLLQQVKEGFRGWPHNDYVADDRKGEDEDRDVNCAARLHNIIRALEEEKTICEDVMNSACQIRMFVNAPKAYANRKFQNRVGNSKRARGKDKDTASDAGARAAKTRKPNPRPLTRARQSSAGVLTARDPPRYASQTPDLPPRERFQSHSATPPVLPSVASPALIGRPRATTLHTETGAIVPVHPPYYGTPLNALSPPQMHKANKARMPSIQPSSHSPFLSPPTLSHDQLSDPASPGDTDPFTSMAQSWMSLSPQQIPPLATHSTDPSLQQQAWGWPTNSQTVPAISANLFDQHPDAALMLPPPQTGTSGINSDFVEFWEGQQGVQPLPHPLPPDDGSKEQN